jgi:hypothetical protein
MLKTTRKRRQHLTQLREAAKVAKKMLFAKKMISSQSIFETLAHKKDAPVLPGIVPYIPDQWTLDHTRQIVMVIVKEWIKKNDKNETEQEKIVPFFRFVIRKMGDQERKWSALARKEKVENRQFEPIASIFSSMRRAETARAVKSFLVDSFAVSVIVKSNGSVSDYLSWFMEDWTPKLNEFWKKDK